MDTEAELPKSFHQIEGNVLLLALRIFSILFVVDTIFAGILYLGLETQIGVEHYAPTLITIGVLHTIRFFVIVIFIIHLTASWARRKYFIGDNRFVVVHGVKSVHEKIYELKNLRSVESFQGFFGRKFNWGDLTLIMSASGGYHEEIFLSGIKDPHKYERILRGYIVAH